MSLAGLERLRPPTKDANGNVIPPDTMRCLFRPFEPSPQDEDQWIMAGGPSTFEEWCEEQRNPTVERFYFSS